MEAANTVQHSQLRLPGFKAYQLCWHLRETCYLRELDLAGNAVGALLDMDMRLKLSCLTSLSLRRFSFTKGQAEQLLGLQYLECLQVRNLCFCPADVHLYESLVSASAKHLRHGTQWRNPSLQFMYVKGRQNGELQRISAFSAV